MPRRLTTKDLNSEWLPLEHMLDRVMQRLNLRQQNDWFTITIRPGGRQDLLGKDMYLRLISFIKDNLERTVTLSKDHTLEGLVDFYLEKRTRYLMIAKYFNHLFRDICDVQEKFLHLLTEIFDAALQEKVLQQLKRLLEEPLRYSSIITKAGEYFTTFFLESSSKPRRLYIETCLLDFHRNLLEMCSVNFSRRFPLLSYSQNEIRPMSETALVGTKHLAVTIRPSNSIGYAIFRHWSLRVEGLRGQWSSYEIERRGRLFSLKYLQGSHSSGENEQESIRNFVGYTFLSDEEIGRYANDVMHMTGMEYDACLNNCQKFCMRLFFCIRTPLTPPMIFEDIDCLPHNAQEILGRRLFGYHFVAPPARELTTLMPISLDSIVLPLWIATILLLVYNTSAPFNAKLLMCILLVIPFNHPAKSGILNLFYWATSYFNAVSETASLISNEETSHNEKSKTVRRKDKAMILHPKRPGPSRAHGANELKQNLLTIQELFRRRPDILASEAG